MFSLLPIQFPFTAGRCALLIAIYVLASIAWATTPQPSVLIVSPEQTGIIQTGGLAHATTGLAIAMNNLGFPTDVLMPYFLRMSGGSEASYTGQRLAVALDWHKGQAHKRSDFSVLRLNRPSNTTYFLRHETIEGQVNYFDNRSYSYGPDLILGESFGAFGKAAADFILASKYDVVILNDWSTGLIALHLHEARLRGRKVPKVIFAIHNIAYQGNFPYGLTEVLGLDPRHYTSEGYEFYNSLSFLKAGMIYSDVTFTVSPQYSREIATPRFGAGLDGVVRSLQNQDRMFGFLNGITEEEWDPSLPNEGLAYTFTSTDLSGKSHGKAEMQAAFGLKIDPKKPVFIMTSRLAEQKGYEYLIDATAMIAKSGDSQWIIIGDGEQKYIERLRHLQSRFPDNVRFRAFASQLEKQLTRYADFGVNGAWFEPSGQSQFFWMKNGTIPVVSAVGGLVDSVQKESTGFLFEIVPGQDGEAYDTMATSLNAASEFRRAIRFYRQQPNLLRQMRARIMNESHSWEARVKSGILPLIQSMLKNESTENCDPVLKALKPVNASE